MMTVSHTAATSYFNRKFIEIRKKDALKKEVNPSDFVI